MKTQPQVNPNKAPVTRDSVSTAPYPVVTKTQLAHTLSEKLPSSEVNQEVQALVLGLTYLKNSAQHLRAARRHARDPNVEYADRISLVLGILESAEKSWPLVIK